MKDLKQSVETLAKESGRTALEIISELQSAARIVGDNGLLDDLCDLKWEYIDA